MSDHNRFGVLGSMMGDEDDDAAAHADDVARAFYLGKMVPSATALLYRDMYPERVHTQQLKNKRPRQGPFDCSKYSPQNAGRIKLVYLEIILAGFKKSLQSSKLPTEFAKGNIQVVGMPRKHYMEYECDLLWYRATIRSMSKEERGKTVFVVVITPANDGFLYPSTTDLSMTVVGFRHDCKGWALLDAKHVKEIQDLIAFGADWLGTTLDAVHCRFYFNEIANRIDIHVADNSNCRLEFVFEPGFPARDFDDPWTEMKDL
jgi:hypothetical protein